MQTIFQRRYLPLVLLAMGGAAHSADDSALKISGFGTAAVAAADTDEAQYSRTRQAGGVGSKLRTGLDSNLGLQATFTATDTLSFTAQALVRKIVTDDYRAELAWAFAKLKVSDKLALRVGRIGLPVYMISDFRNVGYANTMIRPANEVYSLVPADSVEGVDAVYQTGFGSAAVTAQLVVGRTAPRLPGGTKSVMSPIAALHLIAENGPFSYRFGYSKAKFKIEGSPFIESLSAGLRSAGFPDAASDFGYQDISGSFTSVGLVYDERNVLIQGEYSQRRTGTRFVADSTGWYVLAGYRFGKVMPYASYAKLTQDTPTTYTGVPVNVQPFNAIVNGIARSAQQSTATLGVRWDFAPSLALKVQADRVSPRGGAGTLVNATPGFSGPLTVYAAGIDFVF